VPRGKAMRFLPNQGLSPLLHADLDAMASRGEHLARAEGVAAIQAASGLALTLLSRLHPRGITDDETLDDALFAAARRYIEAHLGHHNLTAESIAAGLGRSRAPIPNLCPAGSNGG